MAIELRSYQKVVVAKMKPTGQILDLCPGSGKLFLTLSWYDKFHKGSPLLIVTPASKRETFDWNAGCEEYGITNYKVISWHGFQKWTKANHIIDYVVILDEIHNSAGVTTGFGKSARYVANTAKAWVGATGTMGDLWEKFAIYFIMTGKVKNKTEFMRRFVIMNPHTPFPKVMGYRNEELLKQWLEDITIHLTRADMAKEQDGLRLPPVTVNEIVVNAPDDYAEIAKKGVNRDGNLFNSASEEAHYLRQISSDNKYRELVDLVNAHDGSLIFYSYIKEKEGILQALNDYLDDGHTLYEISGQKKEIPKPDGWREGDIIIANYGSGSEALDLQFSNHTIMLSLPYAYKVYTQAVGRQWRMGQKRPITIDIITADKTIDKDVVKCLKLKKDFSAKKYIKRSY